MKSQAISPQPLTELLRDASSLWKYLMSSAGLDLKHYDPEILSGNGIYQGLPGHLGVSEEPGNFAAELRANNISVEALIQAFFKTWQPYAQMMGDICTFFERNSVKQTDRSIKIVFDFSQVDQEELTFDLEHFNSTVAAIERIKQISEWTRFQKGEHFGFISKFCGGYLGSSKQNDVLAWTKRFSNREIVGIDEFSWTVTSSEKLNFELRRLELIWKTVMRKVVEFDMFEGRHKRYLYGQYDQASNTTSDSQGEPLSRVAQLVDDYWPPTFVNALLKLLEDMEELPIQDRDTKYQTLALQIKSFLDERTVSTEDAQDLVKDLIDLLKLPTWRKRHELYGAWILALCDQTLKEHPEYTLHHDNGILRLPFKKTKLITFSTDLGEIALYSESKNVIVKPKGKSRTNHIQPDYTFYNGEQSGELDAIAVIEVKQYRTPRVSNFQNALDDYAKALPNATVFLTNYGVVPTSMKLDYPKRSHFFGQVRPASDAAKDFSVALLSCLPKTPAIKPKLGSMEVAKSHEELLRSVKRIYVDVSSSLGLDEYKVFVRDLLSWLLPMGQVTNLMAVDNGIRFQWKTPGLENINELLALKFDQGTDFDKVISKDIRTLVVTDEDGAKDLKLIRDGNDLLLIEFSPKEQLMYQGNQPIL
ncbi:hypothetical protein LZD49_04800 [Dyadobacter sp. CY261]|uniref:hypothetical protein n=1 Tax=Dyadobacter sp. CY261 TaxID=2907203 RepID=UPI001F47C4A9|nr:hypothetical protein [Dyadobacter sp. CY261]MCF0069779.1 hypothetical protein [Dyadobacter sp. CY261]